MWTLNEMTEEEYDIAIAEEALQEYVDNGRKSEPIENLWEELEL